MPITQRWPTAHNPLQKIYKSLDTYRNYLRVKTCARANAKCYKVNNFGILPRFLPIVAQSAINPQMIGQENKADIIFVIDSSGSMRQCYDGVKKHIRVFVEELTSWSEYSHRLSQRSKPTIVKVT